MSIAATVSVVTSIANLFQNSNNKKELATGLKDIYKENKGFLPMRTSGSITKLLSSFIVEPIAIVDSSLRTEEHIDKILELNADIFSGYFAQAFDVLVKVYGLDHRTVLDLLSTDKSAVGSVVNYALGTESALTSIDELLDDGATILSIEAYHGKTLDEIEDEERVKAEVRDEFKKKDDQRRNDAKFREELLRNSAKQEEEDRRRKNSLEDDKRKQSNSLKDTNLNRQIDYKAKSTEITEDKNISSIVQKKINIEILINKNNVSHTVVIPMLVKLAVRFVSPKHILDVIDSKGNDKKFSFRLDEYRAGAISLTDLLFGNDLIEKYKTNQLQDHNELLKIINARTANANAKLVTSMGVGYEKYFNLLIVSKATQASMERAVKGKLIKAKYKEKVLEQTNALLLTVVDEDYERVIIYTKDIDGISDITFKSLAKGSKDSGMNDIFKSLVDNRPPVL